MHSLATALLLDEDNFFFNLCETLHAQHAVSYSVKNTTALTHSHTKEQESKRKLLCCAHIYTHSLSLFSLVNREKKIVCFNWLCCPVNTFWMMEKKYSHMGKIIQLEKGSSKTLQSS